jgi:hypothetical protein
MLLVNYILMLELLFRDSRVKKTLVGCVAQSWVLVILTSLR